MLKYCLRENLLTPAPDDYMAQVTDSQVFTLEDVIDRMVKRGTTVTRTDLVAIMQLYTQECSFIVEEGGTLNTPLINTSMSISGVFEGADDAFDKKRHTVNLNINAGTALKTAVGKVKTVKTETASTDPYITEVSDIVPGTVNTTLTKGGVVQLTGSRLKFKADDTAQGIFFVPETGNPVRAAVIAENKPARLMAIIPADLAAGTYYIEVRTKILEGNKSGKTLKTGRFNKAFTVAA